MGKRELIIGRRSRAYVALYRYVDKDSPCSTVSHKKYRIQLPKSHFLIQLLCRPPILFLIAITFTTLSAFGTSEAPHSTSQIQYREVGRLYYDKATGFEVNSMTFSPDGRYLAVGSILSSEVHLWDIKRQAIARTYTSGRRGPSARFNTLRFSPDGRFLAYCARGVEVWEMESGKVISESQIPCRDIAFTPDSGQLAVAEMNSLSLIDVRTWTVSAKIDLKAWTVLNGIVFSPDGERLFAIGSNSTEFPRRDGFRNRAGTLYIFDVKSRQVSNTYSAHSGTIGSQSIAISPDGRYLVLGANSVSTRNRVAPNGELVFPGEDHLETQPLLLFDIPQATMSSLWSIDNALRDALTAEGKLPEIAQLAWTRKGVIVALTRDAQANLRVVDPIRKLHVQLIKQASTAYCFALSANSRMLVVGFANRMTLMSLVAPEDK